MEGAPAARNAARLEEGLPREGSAEPERAAVRTRPDLLATQTKRSHPLWLSRCEVLAGWKERRNPRSFVSSLTWGWRLFRESRSYRAVLTGSESAAHVFAALQLLLRPRPVPHILIECMWNPPESRLGRVLRFAQWRMEIRTLARIVVWSRAQVDRYASGLGVPERKFAFVPYHTSVHGRTHEPSRGDYVFAGGDSNRDYLPLLAAAKGLPWRVVIATRRAASLSTGEVPENVSILSPGPDEFYRLLAGAGIVVVPLASKPWHTGGHQTYLSAMALGKPVIVADDCGADEYVQNHETGIVVPPHDPAALRRALDLLVHDPERAEEMGRKARRAAEEYSLERYCTRLFQVVDESLATGGDSR